MNKKEWEDHLAEMILSDLDNNSPLTAPAASTCMSTSDDTVTIESILESIQKMKDALPPRPRFEYRVVPPYLYYWENNKLPIYQIDLASIMEEGE